MKEIKKEFRKLSELKGRTVSLYKSCDELNTGIYFTEERIPKYFYLLLFEYECEKKEIYIKYPNDNYFTEMYGGSGSGRGNMKHYKCENVFSDKYKKDLNIKVQDDNLILEIGKCLSAFNFMKRIAFYDTGNKFESNRKTETSNIQVLDEIFEMEYQKITDEIRDIAYAYKTLDETPLYIVVDYPKYNFSYEKHRFFVIKNGISVEMKMTNFNRYRDGGTTEIDVIDEFGIKHIFYSPTPFNKKLQPLYDCRQLVEVDKDEKDELIKMLDLFIIEEDGNDL